jgi:hypothetical protein
MCKQARADSTKTAFYQLLVLGLPRLELGLQPGELGHRFLVLLDIRVGELGQLSLLRTKISMLKTME